jgi:hypothetical protein
MLWNDSDDNRDVSSLYEEDEGTGCEDGDSNIDWYRETESDMLVY